LGKGIISPEDQYVLAINSRAIRHDAPYEKTMPLFVQAFLPIGPLVVPINVTTRQFEKPFYQHRDAIAKLSGTSISTRERSLKTMLNSAPLFCTPVWIVQIIPVASAAISRFSTTEVLSVLSTSLYLSGVNSSFFGASNCIGQSLTSRSTRAQHKNGAGYLFR
jgi:hypothetical protein